MFKFRRKEEPWEVVDSKSVDPVPVYYDDEELDIVVVGEIDTRGTYVFDIKHPRQLVDLQRSVEFAKQQLMQQISKKGYNVLLLERWRVTLYRRAKNHRIEVEYTGRPARALGKIPKQRPPPFISVLKAPRYV